MHMRSTHRLAAAAAILAVLAGCASPTRRAPVEDQGRSASSPSGAPAAQPVNRVLPGAENAGKPGYYTIKPGDTLIRIALESGQNWRDIAAWNNLENPNLIEVGQVIRIVAPVDAAATRPVTSPKIESRSLDNGKTPATGKPGAPATTATASSGAASGASAAAAGGASSGSAASSGNGDAKDGEEPNWGWPASGPVIATFEEGKHKGLAISGKAGDPVVASADGHVVYAGSGLRGYGNLVIIKHTGDYLTAYAHNQTLLVKEDQMVKRGQKIAEMGSTGTDRVQLYFEIRKKGKPLDPARQLPGR